MPFLTFDTSTFIGVVGSRAFGRVKEAVIGFKYMIIQLISNGNIIRFINE